MIITVDGPVASGKSSIADTIAQRLGYPCLHTGLLYRALGYLFMQTQAMPDITKLTYTYDKGEATITYNTQDITPFLSDANVGTTTSTLSAQKEVRDLLYTHFFKPYAINHDFVAEGRDCGTVLFPTANVKLFLTASVQKRAERLLCDTRRHVTSLDDAIQDIKTRDHNDQTRALAPLKPAHDAIIIDSSFMTFEETIEQCLAHITHTK